MTLPPKSKPKFQPPPPLAKEEAAEIQATKIFGSGRKKSVRKSNDENVV